MAPPPHGKAPVKGTSTQAPPYKGNGSPGEFIDGKWRCKHPPPPPACRSFANSICVLVMDR